MLIIRLRRTGKIKFPTYRFIVSEKLVSTNGAYLESLGTYNPRTNPATIAVKSERIQYWISKGAQLSDTVHNLLIDQKVITGDKRKIVTPKKSDQPAESAAPAPAAKTEAPTEAKAEEKPAA